MPVYEYSADNGQIIEKVFAMSDKKPTSILMHEDGREFWYDDDGVLFGPQDMDVTTTLDADGCTKFTRVYGNCRVNDMKHAQYPYVSARLKGVISESDAKHVDAKVRGVPFKGVPIIMNKAHEARLMAKYGLTRE